MAPPSYAVFLMTGDQPIVPSDGAELLADDASPVVLEGTVFGPRVVVLRWPSKPAAERWLATSAPAHADAVLVTGLDPDAVPPLGDGGEPRPGEAAGYTVTLIDVHDRDGYKAYARLAFPIMKRFGCDVLVDDPRPDVRAGNVFGSRLIVLRWSSKARALAWYTDPDYQVAIGIRVPATDTRLMAIEGTAG
jgi:uncharacterized protein (DUF1330 family)